MSDTATIAGVVLAAGASARLGRPKQLLPLHGRALLQHVIDAAVAAGLTDVVVVLGHEAASIRAALTLPRGVRAVTNPDYASGQASSLRAGLRAVRPAARAAIILLGDQPDVAPAAIRAVADAYQRTGGPIVRATYGGRPGHPVLFDRSVWPELEGLSGDRGARDLLAADPGRVVEVPLGGEPPPDIDTRNDYDRRLRTAARARGDTVDH